MKEKMKKPYIASARLVYKDTHMSCNYTDIHSMKVHFCSFKNVTILMKIVRDRQKKLEKRKQYSLVFFSTTTEKYGRTAYKLT